MGLPKQDFINALLKKNAAFAVFKEPEHNIKWVAAKEVPQDRSHFEPIHGFHMMPFEQIAASPYYVIEPHFSGEEAVSESVVSQIPGFEKKTQPIPQESTEEWYKNRLGKGLVQMAQSGIEKFVFSRVKWEEADSSNLGNWFHKLITIYPNAFVFVVNHPIYGAWMGATPETFLRTRKNFIVTQALAGTRKCNTKGDWGQKEQKEQAFVANYIASQLAVLNVSYKKSALETRVAGPVEHLLNEFTLSEKIQSQKLRALVEALHPTPAVCGIPRDKAVDIINELEDAERGYYTGFLGFFESIENFGFYVNLRSMQVFINQLALRVGGGITIDSNIDDEWQETALKSQTLLRAIT